MREKGRRDTLFTSMANLKNRPASVYTEFMESDWEMEDDHDGHPRAAREPEDEEIYSDIEDLDEAVEDDGQSSPRSVSLSHP